MFKTKLDVSTLGYLYRSKDGDIIEYRGVVIGEDFKHLYAAPHGTTNFLVVNELGQYVKTLLCAESEGEVTNGCVWFRESNIRRAARVLINYEGQKICELRAQLENRKTIVKSYRKYLKGET